LRTTDFSGVEQVALTGKRPRRGQMMDQIAAIVPHRTAAGYGLGRDFSAGLLTFKSAGRDGI
jgi:hypothetical protein